MAEWKEYNGNHSVWLMNLVKVQVAPEYGGDYTIAVGALTRSANTDTLPAAKSEALIWARELLHAALKELNDARTK